MRSLQIIGRINLIVMKIKPLILFKQLKALMLKSGDAGNKNE